MQQLVAGDTREISVEGFWARIQGLGLRRTAYGTEDHVICVRKDHTTSVRRPDDLTPEQREAELKRVERIVGSQLPNYWDSD